MYCDDIMPINVINNKPPFINVLYALSDIQQNVVFFFLLVAQV